MSRRGKLGRLNRRRELMQQKGGEEYLVGKLASKVLSIEQRFGDERVDERVHDFSDDPIIAGTRNIWWAVLDDLGYYLEANGYRLGIKEGDFVLLPLAYGETRYRVTYIRYGRDHEDPEIRRTSPYDFFYAKLEFDPRSK